MLIDTENDMKEEFSQNSAGWVAVFLFDFTRCVPLDINRPKMDI